MFHLNSIKSKFALLISLIVMISIFIITLTLSFMFYSNTTKQSREDYTKLSEAYEQAVYNKISILKKQLEIVAKNTDITDQSLSLETHKAILDKMAKDSGFDYISVSDANGKTYRNSNISEREYFKQAMNGVSYISDPVINKVDGKLTIMIGVPLNNTTAYAGIVYGGINYEEFISTIISNIKIGKAGYAFLVNKEGIIVAHPDTENVKKGVNYITLANEKSEYRSIASVIEQMITGETSSTYADFQDQEWLISYEPIEGPEGWSLAVIVPTSQVMETFNKTLIICIITGIFLIAAALLISRFMSGKITGSLSKLINRIGLLAQGDLSTEVELVKGKDEVSKLAQALNNTVIQLRSYINDINNVLSAMAANDFTLNSSENYLGDFIPIKKAIDNMASSLSETFAQISDSAEHFNTSAEQVANTSKLVSQGSTEQAGALEQLMVSIKQILQDSNDGKPGDEFHNGININNVLVAMEDIKKSSEKISKIIKTIDDIAFQTNILSLNAAVEAARAGSAGKGFAVVADEVRNLAVKSAEAASHTSELVNASIQSIDKEYSYATEAIRQIDRSHSLQSEAIIQIRQNLEKINSVIQTNSQTAEESAAASEELSTQAIILREQISKFKLNNDNLLN